MTVDRKGSEKFVETSQKKNRIFENYKHKPKIRLRNIQIQLKNSVFSEMLTKISPSF